MTKVPLILWSYWSGNTNNILDACSESWNKNLKDWKLHLLNPNNIIDYVSYDNLGGERFFKNLSPVFQSDLIRINLLYIYGGVWLDATTFMNQNLDWIHKYFDTDPEREILCSIKAIPADPQKRYIWENNFIACTPNSYVMKCMCRDLPEVIKHNFPLIPIPFVKMVVLIPNYHYIYFLQYHLRVTDPLIDNQFKKYMLNRTEIGLSWNYTYDVSLIIMKHVNHYMNNIPYDMIFKYKLLKVESIHRHNYVKHIGNNNTKYIKTIKNNNTH